VHPYPIHALEAVLDSGKLWQRWGHGWALPVVRAEELKPAGTPYRRWNAGDDEARFTETFRRV
jgi:hypothetical protein